MKYKVVAVAKIDAWYEKKEQVIGLIGEAENIEKRRNPQGFVMCDFRADNVKEPFFFLAVKLQAA